MVSLYKNHLEKAGHEVTVFTIGPRSEIREEGTVVVSPGLQYGNSGYFLTFRFSRLARQLLKEMDIVHCHHPLMGLELASRYVQCPIVFTNHTRYDLYTAALTPLLEKPAIRFSRSLLPMILRRSDRIIAPTESMRKLLKEWGVNTPIEVIGNGIELENFLNSRKPIDKTAIGIAKDGITVIYVGRLSAEKRVDILIAAFSEAKAEVPELNLLLVGDGPDRDKLEKMVEELGISSSVVFLGQVPFDSVPGYLAVADFFTTASISEVHPLSVMEAMAAALPIVGFYSPGLEGVVTVGGNSLLCDSGQDNLARSIITLAIDDRMRKAMSLSSLDKSQEYDFRKTAEMTLRLYTRVLSSHKRRTGLLNSGRDLISSYLRQ